MSFISDLSLTAQVGLGSVFIYVVYLFATSINTWSRRRAFRQQHGTAEAPWLAQRERWIGWDVVKASRQAAADHKLLEVTHNRFLDLDVHTFQMVTFGRHVHVTREPANLKTIQASDFKKWSLGTRRKIDFRPLLGVGIFTTDGGEWQHSRDMLRPNFVRSQIGDVATFENHVSQLIKIIRKNETVDLGVLFFRLTIDSATEFLFGESTGSLSRDQGEGFAEAFTESQDFIAKQARFGRFGKLMVREGWDKFAKDCKFVHDFVDTFVEKGIQKHQLSSVKSNGEKGTTGRYVFIDELINQTTDRVRIRDELLNILLAGRDTTASLLTNVWFILSKRPDIWKKLQAEVDRLGGEIPTFEQLKDLKYLKALLSESLRLHPVVPLNSREAVEDTTLPLGGGPDGQSPVFIAKGTIVAWNVYSMHRRKDYYGEDADEFRPERWLDDPTTGEKGLRTGWEYLPFNGGARICLGQQFALTEASYTTVRLCQVFSEIHSRDNNAEWTEFLTLTCVNLHGAKVALTPRA